MKKLSVLVVLLAIMLTITPVLAYNNIVYYRGQGLIPGGDGSWVIKKEICGLSNGADVEGPYLLWVLTATGAKNADITILGSTHQMVKYGNGTFKYISQWYNPDQLMSGAVFATYDGRAKNVQLTISHGCAPHSVGAWCSPGYWKNTLNQVPNGWTTIGITPPGPYYNDVISSPVATDSPTLLDVLQNKQLYFDPNQQGAGFNAVAAYLTDLIPGYHFDPTLVGESDACPLDAHGNFK